MPDSAIAQNLLTWDSRKPAYVSASHTHTKNRRPVRLTRHDRASNAPHPQQATPADTHLDLSALQQVHTPATLRQLDGERVQCQTCKKPFASVPNENARAQKGS